MGDGRMIIDQPARGQSHQYPQRELTAQPERRSGSAEDLHLEPLGDVFGLAGLLAALLLQLEVFLLEGQREAGRALVLGRYDAIHLWCAQLGKGVGRCEQQV